MAVVSSPLLSSAGGPPRSLKKLFIPPPAEKCTRCDQRVYQVEKVGPVNEVIFHKQCFRCCQCGQHLTLKTYFTNQDNFTDKEIYCGTHCPRVSAHGYDARAVGIRSAINVPTPASQLNYQIRGMGENAPKIGSDAMHIRGALSAQNHYQKKYITKYDKHHFPAYLVSKTKDKLFEYQEQLERQQREEEDRLMAVFQQERKKEAQSMEKELNDEWETQLKELTDKYETTQKAKSKDKAPITTERYEQEKEQLKKTMTIKMIKKKEALTVKLQKEAQQETATLVKKHSEQMLQLLRDKQEELTKELVEEIKSGPAIDDSVIEEAIAAITLTTDLPEAHPPMVRKRDIYHDPIVFQELDEDVFRVAESEQSTFTDLVKQLTAHCISDLQKARAIFRWITVKDLNVMEFDEAVQQDTPLGLLRGIKYGTESYHTLFMRLCSYAGLPCQEIKGHSKSVGYEPGMKIREGNFLNTWNLVLIGGDWWPVQCNWGARHLVLNKDLQEKRKDSADGSGNRKKQDKIRYQYDEHYFLTDPDEFIQEFWAQDPEWQLIERPVTLEEFEGLPFVRSVFFHYGLEFAEPLKAVLMTDNRGGTEVKIAVPPELAEDLVFHYQLRFADRERREDIDYKGAKLERFVFHTLTDGYALFSIHVPTPASYFLEVFAIKIDDSNRIGDDPNATMMPFRLKCACKFKVVCEELTGKMHPLPNCASGEWGPSKGLRHFNLVPESHRSGVVGVDNDVEIRLKVQRPLYFLCKLRLNGVDDHALERFVAHSVHDGVLTIKVNPPQTGQYGLDIYARPEDAANSHTLAHACKFLLNCTRVNAPIELPSSPNSSKNSNSKAPPVAPEEEKFGPLPSFDTIGLKTISHKDPTIDKIEKGGVVTIEIGLIDSYRMSFKLIRMQTEDWSHKVAVKDSGKKIKFTISLPKNGVYKFALFAGKKDEPENTAINVYNYKIHYVAAVDDNTKQKKKK